MTRHIAQCLRQAAAHLQRECVSLQLLARAHGSSTHGGLLLLMAALCLLPIPGVGTVIVIALVALAIAMWHGQVAERFPARVSRLELPRQGVQRVLNMQAAIYAATGCLATPRLTKLAIAGKRSLTAVGLMAVVVMLPISFGNLLCLLSLVLIALALIFWDCVAMLLGIKAAVFALVMTAGLVSAAWFWNGELLTRWALP